jgi:hypothetical protein
LDQYNLQKHQKNKINILNLMQGLQPPMANKRQYATTHSGNLMFPAAMENVILDKWASLWLLD